MPSPQVGSLFNDAWVKRRWAWMARPCTKPNKFWNLWRRSSPALRAPRDSEPANLIEQIPAVVFIVCLDRGVGEAYVSPQIESMLGFTRAEWLEDPIRWYERIHPDDKSLHGVDRDEDRRGNGGVAAIA